MKRLASNGGGQLANVGNIIAGSASNHWDLNGLTFLE
jgi:hypothetical protein